MNAVRSVSSTLCGPPGRTSTEYVPAIARRAVATDSVDPVSVIV